VLPELPSVPESTEPPEIGDPLEELLAAPSPLAPPDELELAFALAEFESEESPFEGTLPAPSAGPLAVLSLRPPSGESMVMLVPLQAR
jgi:hypothetical protein